MSSIQSLTDLLQVVDNILEFSILVSLYLRRSASNKMGESLKVFVLNWFFEISFHKSL